MKTAIFIGSAREDLRSFPSEVRRVMGAAIYDAQKGDEHPRVKALKGFGGRSVLEVERSIPCVSQQPCTFSTPFRRSGVATRRHDVELIKLRLKRAAIHYETHFGKGTSA